MLFLLSRPQAVWTRFFPASLEIKRLLAQGALGELKMVRAEFGAPLLGVPRAMEKELGGGALLDIGIYCLQFACMVFQGERPESVQASGGCLETGTHLGGNTWRQVHTGGGTPGDGYTPGGEHLETGTHRG